MGSGVDLFEMIVFVIEGEFGDGGGVEEDERVGGSLIANFSDVVHCVRQSKWVMGYSLTLLR